MTLCLSSSSGAPKSRDGRDESRGLFSRARFILACPLAAKKVARTTFRLNKSRRTRLIAGSADNDSRCGLRKRPFSGIFARSTLFIAARKSPANPLRNLVPATLKRSEMKKERKRNVDKRELREEDKRAPRRAMITRCSRYNSGPGVAARPFTCVCTRWMVNVKPRVSLAWPPRCPDHNAWSSFSQADHDHGDPTFFVCSFAPSSSPPLPLPRPPPRPPRSSTLLGIARTGPFPLKERARVLPTFSQVVLRHRSLRASSAVSFARRIMYNVDLCFTCDFTCRSRIFSHKQIVLESCRIFL